jgi:hypothetical protein
MKRLDFFEDYFVSLYQKFGISKLTYDKHLLHLDDKDMHKMIFSSDDFDKDYERLKNRCNKVYRILKRGYLIRVRQDYSNNCYVTID